MDQTTILLIAVGSATIIPIKLWLLLRFFRKKIQAGDAEKKRRGESTGE